MDHCNTAPGLREALDFSFTFEDESMDHCNMATGFARAGTLSECCYDLSEQVFLIRDRRACAPSLAMMSFV